MLRPAETEDAYYYNDNKYICSASISFHPYISLFTTGLRFKIVSLRITIFSRDLISCQNLLLHTMCLLLAMRLSLSFSIFTKSTRRITAATNHFIPNPSPQSKALGLGNHICCQRCICL